MRFSQEWLKQLKNRVDLLDLAREYTEMHKAGPNLYVGHCPHPNHNDSDASFTIDIKKQTWCCYGCHSDKKNKKQGNYGSDCIAFIEWVFNGKKSWIDCVKYLAEKVNLPLPKDNYDKQYAINYKLAQKYINDMTEDAYEYLYDRGLNDESIEKWNICYDKNENRIVFPLYDSYKNIVGFNKRLISPLTKGLERKYIHSSDSDIFKKSQYFYGLNHLDKSKDYVILTEGVFDCILPDIYGLDNVICALGTTLSEYQINILKKMNKTVIIAYDNDEKGQKTIKKVMPLLIENNIKTKLFLLPEGKDLADLTNELKHDIRSYVFSNLITYEYYLIEPKLIKYLRDSYNLLYEYKDMFDYIPNNIQLEDKLILKEYIKAFFIENMSSIGQASMSCCN